jgi:hypothetical protein
MTKPEAKARLPLAVVKPLKPFGQMTDAELLEWLEALHEGVTSELHLQRDNAETQHLLAPD